MAATHPDAPLTRAFLDYEEMRLVATRLAPPAPTGNETHDYQSQRDPGDPNRLTFWEDRAGRGAVFGAGAFGAGAKGRKASKSVYKLVPAAPRAPRAAAKLAAHLAPPAAPLRGHRAAITAKWDALDSKRAAEWVASREAKHSKLETGKQYEPKSSLAGTWLVAKDTGARGQHLRASLAAEAAVAAAVEAVVDKRLPGQLPAEVPEWAQGESEDSDAGEE